MALFAPQVIIALHTDYIDTPVIIYAVLALACITAARESRYWPGWIFLAGMCFTSMAIANFSSLAALGVGIGVFHLVWLRWGVLRHIGSIIVYLAGAGALIAVIQWIHTRVGASFHFLQPQIDMLFYMNDLEENPWSPENWLWTKEATWVVAPACAWLIGVYRCLVSRSNLPNVRWLTFALTAGLTVSLSMAIALEFRGHGVLYYDYYASFYLCFALPLLVICSTASSAPKATNIFWSAGSLAILIILVLAGDGLANWKILQWILPFLGNERMIPVFIVALLMIIAVMVIHWPASRMRSVISRNFVRPELMLLGVIVCSIPYGFHSPHRSDRLSARYSVVHQAYQTLAETFPRGSYQFWSDSKNKDSVSLASTKLWAYRLFTLKPFPEIEPGASTNKTVVLPVSIGSGEQALATAIRLFDDFDVDLLKQQIIPVPGEQGRGFDLVCFSLRPRAYDEEAAENLSIPVNVLLDLQYDSTQPYTDSLDINTYGIHGEPVIDQTKGYPTFNRTDSRDHLATSFVTIPEFTPGETREFSLYAYMPDIGPVLCVIQTQNLENFQEIALNEMGRTVHKVVVPPETTSIRLSFISEIDGEVALPTRLKLSEVRPAKVELFLEYHYAEIPPYTDSLLKTIYQPNEESPFSFAKGYPEFLRTDPQDHLAIPFTPLTNPALGENRNFSMTIVMPAEGQLSCIVQGGGFQEITRFTLNQKGRSVRSILVPAKHSSLRFYLQSDTDDLTPLPTSITLNEIYFDR